MSIIKPVGGLSNASLKSIFTCLDEHPLKLIGVTLVWL
jgi:hypothetical protein